MYVYVIQGGQSLFKKQNVICFFISLQRAHISFTHPCSNQAVGPVIRSSQVYQSVNIKTAALSHTKVKPESVINLPCMLFGLWEENGDPGENPHRLKENTRKPQARLRPGAILLRGDSSNRCSELL